MGEETFFHYLIIGWVALGAGVFVLLFFVTAPYGRHVRSGWGPVLSQRTAWILMETPALYVFIGVYLLGEKKFEPVPLICACLWCFHYTYRSVVYPLLMPDGEKKVPLSILLSAVVFNFVNAFIQARFLSHFQNHLTQEWFTDWRFILGAVMFFSGFYIHFWHDRHIQDLKKKYQRYVIPEGGLFKYISSPNYFGEMIEWGGWAVLTWSLAGFSFFFWTFANLFPRAISNHRWYREKFPEYPERRKAIIPFVI